MTEDTRKPVDYEAVCFICDDPITDDRLSTRLSEVKSEHPDWGFTDNTNGYWTFGIDPKVHMDCSVVLGYSVTSTPELYGIKDGINRKFYIPTTCSPRTPIFLNGVLLKERTNYVRYSNVIFFQNQVPVEGDILCGICQ